MSGSSSPSVDGLSGPSKSEEDKVQNRRARLGDLVRRVEIFGSGSWSPRSVDRDTDGFLRPPSTKVR